MKLRSATFLGIGILVLISSQIIMAHINESSLPAVSHVKFLHSNSVDVTSITSDSLIQQLKPNLPALDDVTFNRKRFKHAPFNYQLPTHRQARFTYISDEPK